MTFCFFFFVFIHVASCLYVLLAEMQPDVERTWFTDYENDSTFDKYVVSLYFVITTTATVGYWDVAPATSFERIFCIFLMVIGVTGFTFVSGALSSIMQNHDSLVSETQEKLLHLNRIKDQTNIPEDLYNEIRGAITFDAKRSNSDHE